MRSPLPWCQHLWLAMGLRGRLVAGYTALFGVLLLGIAVGETTVVRRALIDNRRAALPGAMSDLASFLAPVDEGGQPVGDRAMGVGLGRGGSLLTYQGPLPAVAGNNEMVLALLGADGSVISRVAGSGVRDVDPLQLLDPQRSGDDSGAPTVYERTVGATTYLVAARTISMASVGGVPTEVCVGQGCALGLHAADEDPGE